MTTIANKNSLILFLKVKFYQMTTGKDHDVKLYDEFMEYITKLSDLNKDTNKKTKFTLVFMVYDNRFENFTHFEFPRDEKEFKEITEKTVGKKPKLSDEQSESLKKGWQLWNNEYKKILTVEYYKVDKIYVPHLILTG